MNQLCADEIEKIIELLTKKIDVKVKSNTSNHEIISRERENKIYCKVCGSMHIHKNGKTKVGRQKYICYDCHKCFSDTTNSILYYSKSPYDIWKRFIYCEIRQMTLLDTANELNISKTCAFNWRHKFHKALEFYTNDINLSGEIQLDATYTSINLKGTKPENMPRYSKKRPSSAYRGLSHHKVCIMSGCDDHDNIAFKITGLGKETTEYYEIFGSKIVNPTLLITDQSWGFISFSKSINCELDQIPTTAYKSPNGHTLAELNQIHSELKIYMKKYHGVSIRHLQGYLNKFVFLKMLKYKVDYHERVLKSYLLTIPAFTTLSNSEISKLTLPIDLKVAYAEYNYGIFA